MENINIILLVVAIVAVVFAMITIIIPYLTKKGVNISGALSTANTALNTADMVVDSLQGIFPDIPAFALIDKIIGWAKKGAEAAEQLYKTSKITEDQRKEEAAKLVYEFINMAGIELNDDMKKIVDGCIEAAVFALPKTHTEENAAGSAANETA